MSVKWGPENGGPWWGTVGIPFSCVVCHKLSSGQSCEGLCGPCWVKAIKRLDRMEAAKPRLFEVERMPPFEG